MEAGLTNCINEELGADEVFPAKTVAAETDAESGDFLSNTANSEISSGEEDPMDQHPQILLPQAEQNAVPQTHPHALPSFIII